MRVKEARGKEGGEKERREVFEEEGGEWKKWKIRNVKGENGCDRTGEKGCIGKRNEENTSEKQAR